MTGLFVTSNASYASESGKRWQEVNVFLITIYIDDSGTDPGQHVAIATALVIPAAQIIRLQAEWDTFREKEGFKCFHASVFVSRNQGSEFANWNSEKQGRVFRRVRQITKKYGCRAFSVAVNKIDYDEVAPKEIRNHLGKSHYSWAVRQLLINIDHIFPPKAGAQREFIFHWMERRVEARGEIEDIMDEMQFAAKKQGICGDYARLFFRKSDGIPGLQCVDAVSWISYQYALHIYRKNPLRQFVPESWKEFEGDHHFDGWLRAATIRRENLEKSIEQAKKSDKFFAFYKEWEEHRAPVRNQRT